MVFTLTLSRNKVSYPGPGWLILIGFLVAIAIASFGSYIVPSPIKEALAELQDKPFYYSVAAGFIGASLVVPTISGWLFERRERARELERLESASRGDAS
jgi:hypothetical protein